MGAAGAKLAETYQKKANLDEERARKRILREAEKFGAELEKPDAKGGLPAQLVLDSLRRDRYRCKRCGSRKKIGPHHKGGIVESRWLSEKGHTNVLPNIATLCARCHDAVHNQAREDGVDSGQVLPAADAGTKKDRGQAKVDPKKIQALLTHRKRVQIGAAGGATDWDESKHPRGDHGMFGEGGGTPGGRQGDPKVSALVERARVAAEHGNGNGKGLKAAHRLGERAIAATSAADRTKATAKLADHVARLERKQGAVTDLGKVSGKEADTWGNGQYAQWHQSLAPEERQAITKYTANGVEFRTAQRRLRGMSPPDPKSDDHEIDPMIDHLDKALSRSKLPSSLQAYRGAVGMPVPKVGSTFQDKGYMSTSVRQESTQAYLEQETGPKIFYKILLPKGTKGGYVSSLGPNPQDNEVLLPRGSKFRITKVTELNPNHHEVEMHIVDD